MPKPRSSQPEVAVAAERPATGVATVEQIQVLEKRLIEEWGYPAVVLMERAALAVTHFLDRQYPGAPVVVMCGTGNNAADGIATARMLLDRGRTVRVLTVGSSLGELASKQMAWLNRRGLQAKGFSGSESFGQDWVLVDAVFGIGLNRPLKSDALLAIDWVNRGPWRAIVAIDVPSGLQGTTGEPMGAAVQAHHTIALGCLKTGLLADPALRRVGRLWLADIGFPASMIEPLPGRLNRPHPMPPVSPDAHKGSLGTTMIIAGSATMSGAAILATRAACRSGVGLVYLAIAASQREMAAMAVPEAIVLPLPEREGTIGPETVAVLLPHLQRVRALAIGPGLGHSPRVRELVEKLLVTYDGPVVLDADALPRAKEALPGRMAPVIMTPHAGELARMLDSTSEKVQAERLGAGLEAARRHRAITVFKGARTVIARPDGSFAINATGLPMLATAGSGDVLTGLIAGLLGRGMEAFEAACTGVYVHGRAAEAAADSGMVSLVAGDVVDRIPHLLGQPAAIRQPVGDVQLIH
ncbi:MAG: carbohydrate kinase, YjeF related protein [Cyanobacteria bacterium RYN_339]|nr:carbohydrate kinase, YjeF related protein [Cyanobacteria bacterium RYN_339]